MLGVNVAGAAVVVTAEDLVEKAISSSITVQTAFNTQTSNAISNDTNVKNSFNSQVSTAISNDTNVQNSFNSQVSNAISNDNSVKNSLTTSINTVNNQAGNTVTYVNPPTVNGQPLFALPTSKNDGDHLMYDGLGTTDVSAKKLLIKASAASRTQLVNFGQASSQQRTAASFQRILSDFYRFSYGMTANSMLGSGSEQYQYTHTNNPMINNGVVSYGNHAGASFSYQGNAQPNEEAAWQMNANNEITQSLNSFMGIGFASPADETYDTYDAIVTAKSTGTDDDFIGFVLALNRGNPNDENANSPADSYIAVYRTLNDSVGMGVKLVYNQSLSGSTVLGLSSAADGFQDIWANSLDGAGWSAYNGCPFKIERRPNRIRIWAIDNVANSPDWDSAAWGDPLFDIDLTSSAILSQFTVPGNWGLFAQSQGGCSWGDLYFNGVNEGGLAINPTPDPAINNMVFDIESGTTYVWSNGAWIQDPQNRTVHDYVDSGQLLLDTSSKSLYIKDNGELQLLQSQRIETVNLTANSGITVNDLGKLIIASPGCSVITFNGQYGAGWHCTILNLSDAPLRIETGGAFGAGSRFGDRNLQMNNTHVMVANSAEIRCYGNGYGNGANIHPIISNGNYGI
jgi:hypothetical protein